MNFRPLPQPVQDAFNAAIVDLLEDSTIFAHADRNFIEKLEAAKLLSAGIKGQTAIQKVSGHNDHATKSCTGFRVNSVFWRA